MDYLGRPTKRQRGEKFDVSELPEGTIITPYNATFQAADIQLAYDTTPILLSSYLDTNDTDIAALHTTDVTLQTQVTTHEG